MSNQKQCSPWDQGATVKLKHCSSTGEIGWAKRDEAGKLVTIFSNLPMEPSEWRILEDRGIDLDAVAEWVGLHYPVNFSKANSAAQQDWIERFIAAHPETEHA